MTTLATFYATYRDLSLTSVTNLDEPPQDVTTAQLPCKWVDTVGVDEAPLRAKGVGGERTLRARVVVAVTPAGQDRHADRWSDALAMVDTLNAGIKTVASRPSRWSMDVDPNFNGYFAVVAAIESPERTI